MQIFVGWMFLGLIIINHHGTALFALRLSVLVVITSELIARGCAVKCKLGEGKGTIAH